MQQIVTDDDVVRVRQLVRAAAVATKLTLVDQTKLVTAASELARNTLVHGGGGRAEVQPVYQRARRRDPDPFRRRGPRHRRRRPGADRRLLLRRRSGAGPVRRAPTHGRVRSRPPHRARAPRSPPSSGSGDPWRPVHDRGPALARGRRDRRPPAPSAGPRCARRGGRTDRGEGSAISRSWPPRWRPTWPGTPSRARADAPAPGRRRGRGGAGRDRPRPGMADVAESLARRPLHRRHARHRPRARSPARPTSSTSTRCRAPAPCWPRRCGPGAGRREPAWAAGLIAPDRRRRRCAATPTPPARSTGRRQLLLCDGLGHGAAGRGGRAGGAGRVHRPRPRSARASCCDHLHRRIRHTRGVVAGVAELDRDAVSASPASATSSAAIVDGGRRRAMVSLPGIVGQQYREAREFDYPLAAGRAGRAALRRPHRQVGPR